MERPDNPLENTEWRGWVEWLDTQLWVWYRAHHSLGMSVLICRKRIMWEERGLYWTWYAGVLPSRALSLCCQHLASYLCIFFLSLNNFQLWISPHNLWIKEKSPDFSLADFMYPRKWQEREGEELKGIAQEVEMSKESKFLPFILGPWVTEELSPLRIQHLRDS